MQYREIKDFCGRFFPDSSQKTEETGCIPGTLYVNRNSSGRIHNVPFKIDNEGNIGYSDNGSPFGHYVEMFEIPEDITLKDVAGVEPTHYVRFETKKLGIYLEEYFE